MDPIKHTAQFAFLSNGVKVSLKYPGCSATANLLPRMDSEQLLEKISTPSSIHSLPLMDRPWQRQGLDHQAEAQQPYHLLLFALMPTTALWGAQKCQEGSSHPKKLQLTL